MRLRPALLGNARVGDTIAVERFGRRLTFPNVTAVNRSRPNGLHVVEIVDEAGRTYAADAASAVYVVEPILETGGRR